jgi:hypothetical protein
MHRDKSQASSALQICDNGSPAATITGTILYCDKNGVSKQNLNKVDNLFTQLPAPLSPHLPTGWHLLHCNGCSWLGHLAGMLVRAGASPAPGT